MRLSFIVMCLVATILSAQPRNLDRDVAAIVKSHNVPGAAVVVFSKNQILGLGAAGVREVGKSALITAQDRFHIGSNAKAMLATMLATLVEDRTLGWDSRPVDVLLAMDAQPAFATMTLTELLNHHAGFAAFDDDTSAEWKAWLASPRDPSVRPLLRFSRYVLSQSPAVAPVREFLYSNAGYSVAAAMAEQVTGKDWKELMQARLFGPLGITADFGYSEDGQPVGHYETNKGLQVRDPSDTTPPFLQPAGDVQLSVLDYAKFLQLHLRGLTAADGLLRAETVRRLHTPVGKVALGWGVREFEGATSHVHSGSAGSFYAVTALQPSRNLGVAVVVNSGGERADKACGEALRKFLAQFRKRSTK